MTGRTSASDGWVPAWQPDEPDIETVRQIAHELVWDQMHFHERAMADPFEAEAYVHDVGRRLFLAVGHMTGTKVYEVQADSKDSA